MNAAPTQSAQGTGKRSSTKNANLLRCSFCDKPMTETGKIQWFGMGYERRDGTKVYDAIILNLA